MSTRYARLTELLQGPVRSKRNPISNIGFLRAKARRIVRHAPEVMVKISSHCKGSERVRAHLHYISRNGKLPLEDEQGNLLKDVGDIHDLHKGWMRDTLHRKPNTRDTTNIILSMPPDTDPNAVKNAARLFARTTFAANHQYVFVLHTDEAHPHVHLCVKNLGFDGKRLQVKKGDPQRWREAFAEEVRKQGIDAEATPRALRGVVLKAASQVIQHLRRRGIEPEVDKAQKQAILKEVEAEQAHQPIPSKPWEVKIKQRQHQIRSSWLQSAKDLSTSHDQEDRTLANHIVRFVKAMPPPHTKIHLVRQQTINYFRQRQQTFPDAQKVPGTTSQPKQEFINITENPQAVLKLAEKVADEKCSDEASRRRFLEGVRQRLAEEEELKRQADESAGLTRERQRAINRTHSDRGREDDELER